MTREEAGIDQEVELEASGLAQATTYTIFIDRKLVATFETDKRGSADVEVSTSPKQP